MTDHLTTTRADQLAERLILRVSIALSRDLIALDELSFLRIEHVAGCPHGAKPAGDCTCERLIVLDTPEGRVVLPPGDVVERKIKVGRA